MSVNFKEIMTQRSDAELIEILTKKQEEYQPEAISAAEVELEKRNLSFDKMESAKQELIDKEKIIEENANKPLGIGWKLVTFFVPGIPNFLIARTLKAEGYERKWKEAWRWTFYGIAFYASLVFLVLML
jgi:hypothetical protein